MGIQDEHAEPEVVDARFKEMLDEAVKKAIEEKEMEKARFAPWADPDAPVIRDGKVWELMTDYRADYLGHLGQRTLKVYSVLFDWFVAKFGSLPIREVRATDVERKTQAEDWSDGYRRLCMAVVQGFVRWTGRINFKLNMPVGDTRGEEVVLTTEEADLLINAAEGDYRAFLEYLRFSWCRPIEARTLTVEMVSWDRGLIDLKKHKTRKKGKQRLIYLTPAGQDILQRQREKYGSGLLFRNDKGGMFSMEAVNSRMRRLRKKVGLRDEVISYSFRITGATRALEQGVPDSDVAALMGHSGTAMLHKCYSKITSNTRRLKDVAARMDGKA